MNTRLTANVYWYTCFPFLVLIRHLGILSKLFSFCAFATVDQGTEETPLVIRGSRDAVISAFSGDRSLMWDQKVVDIRHSWISLEVRCRDHFDLFPQIRHITDARLNDFAL